MDLVLDFSVARNTLFSFEIFHEVAKVFGPTLQDLLGSIEDSDLRLDFGQDLFHLLVLGVFASKIGSILSEIISLHVLSTSGSCIFSLFVGHSLLECSFFDLKLLYLSLLLVLLLCQHGCLRFEDTKFIVSWSINLKLIFKDHAILLQSLNIICEPLKLILSSNWFLEKQLHSLKSLPFIIELSSEILVLEFSILSGVGSQIIEKLVWSKVLIRYLLDVCKSLLDCKHILFVELHHVGKFALLLTELGILLLFLSKFGGSFKECRKVSLIALSFEHVDLCQQLLFFLFELVDLLLQLGWIHTFGSHVVHVLMSGLELSLKILVHLEGLSHLFVTQELIWDLKRYQKFGCVRSSLELIHFGDEPVQKMLDGLLLTMDDISLEGWIKVTWVSENFKEPTDSFLCFILGFTLDINLKMCRLEMSQDTIQKFEKLKWCLVIELNETEVTHEWWLVQTVNDDLDLCGAQSWGLREYLSWSSVGKEPSFTTLCCLTVVVHILNFKKL